MKIKIRDIPPEGFYCELEEEGDRIAGLAAKKVDFSFLAPVRASLSISKAEDTLSVRGRIETVVLLSCSRCLKDVEHRIDKDFSLFFTKEGAPEQEELELTGEEIELVHMEGDEIDTDEVLLEQIALDIPQKPLCASDCKGLCPRCGADLNLGRCGCPQEKSIDPRFAKLKDFKIK